LLYFGNCEDTISVSVPGSAPAAGIGRSKFPTIQDFADAVTVKYQQLYDQGHALVSQRVAQGLIADNRTIIGAEIDVFARQGLRRWLANAEGIVEGRGKIISVNRRLYDPAGTGLYRQPDVYIPGAGLILDGSIMRKTVTMPQIVDFRSYSTGANVTIIRPMLEGGSYSFLF